MHNDVRDASAPGSPYLLEDPPRSEGRALLSRSLEEYAAIEWGIGPRDIAAVFQRRETDHEDAAYVESCLRIACTNLLDLLLAGRLRSFARPLGGGRPTALQPHVWEVDDPFPRFSTSAINAEAPFDDTAPRTHWLLVDAGDLAQISARLCEGPGDREIPEAVVAPGPPGSPLAGSPDVGIVADPAPAAGFLRLADVALLTKMSRSTIYAKAARKEFPEPVRLGSRWSRWRETEVAEWLRTPR